jgi:hypothetical protein
MVRFVAAYEMTDYQFPYSEADEARIEAAEYDRDHAEADDYDYDRAEDAMLNHGRGLGLTDW